MSLTGIGDLMKLMGQAGKIRENMAQMQERVKQRVVEGESGAGMVKVIANGAGEVLDIKIDPEVLKDPETVGPLVAAAVNVAMRKSKEIMMEEMKTAMGGIDLPPGMMGV